MVTMTQDNLLPVKWKVEYKPPGGNWTVLAIDSAAPSPLSGLVKGYDTISRSYNSPQGALGTWQMRVSFEQVPTQVRMEDYLGNIYYETVMENETVKSVKSRKLSLSHEAVISGKTTSTYKRSIYVPLPKPGP